MWVQRLVSLLLVAGAASAYRPVFMMHGVGSGGSDWDVFAQHLAAAHPGTLAVALPLYEGNLGSSRALQTQADGIAAYIRQTVAANRSAFSQGYHLVCHSQGGLTCRAVIERMDDHAVDTFISLSGTQLGIYGDYGTHWPCTTIESLYKCAYNRAAQLTSQANQWHDPMHEAEYLEGNTFLPPLNNQVNHSDASRYKANFIRLKHASFFGGPDDGVIKPWTAEQCHSKTCCAS